MLPFPKRPVEQFLLFLGLEGGCKLQSPLVPKHRQRVLVAPLSGTARNPYWKHFVEINITYIIRVHNCLSYVILRRNFSALVSKLQSLFLALSLFSFRCSGFGAET